MMYWDSVSKLVAQGGILVSIFTLLIVVTEIRPSLLLKLYKGKSFLVKGIRKSVIFILIFGP